MVRPTAVQPNPTRQAPQPGSGGGTRTAVIVLLTLGAVTSFITALAIALNKDGLKDFQSPSWLNRPGAVVLMMTGAFGYAIALYLVTTRRRAGASVAACLALLGLASMPLFTVTVYALAFNFALLVLACTSAVRTPQRREDAGAR